MTGMSTPEFFGIFLAAAASVASVLFMMIGYSAAKVRHFRMMLQYLRLAGVLSMASWIVMLAVMFRCEHVCWVVRQQPQNATPALQIVDDPVYSFATPSGYTLTWGQDNAGLPSVLGRGGPSSSVVRGSRGSL